MRLKSYLTIISEMFLLYGPGQTRLIGGLGHENLHTSFIENTKQSCDKAEESNISV